MPNPKRSKWEYHHRRSKRFIERALRVTQQEAFPIMHQAALSETLACRSALQSRDKDLISKLTCSAVALWLQAGRPDLADDLAGAVMRMGLLSAEAVSHLDSLRKIGKEIGFIPSVVTFDDEMAVE